MGTDIRTLRNCRRCTLCENQPPLIQQSTSADVFWVGLSAVKTSDPHDIPLSPVTNTGKLINSVEFFFHDKTFHKTNLVKCLPLENGKIRYPSTKEMKDCHFNLQREIKDLKPKLIFLLGKQVATFVLREVGVNEYYLDDAFEYHPFVIENCWYVPIHHPSFILVYKRKVLADYIHAIEKMIYEREQKIFIPDLQEEALTACFS